MHQGSRHILEINRTAAELCTKDSRKKDVLLKHNESFNPAFTSAK